MRLTLLVTLLIAAVTANAQINQSLIYGKWYITKLEGQGISIDKNNKRETIHKLLENERNNGTEIGEADSLNVAVEMEKMFKMFDDVYMEFKKNGTAIFNLGDLKDKEEKGSGVLKSDFKWKSNNELVTKEANNKEEVIKVLTLTQSELALEFTDEESLIVFTFKRQ